MPIPPSFEPLSHVDAFFCGVLCETQIPRPGETSTPGRYWLYRPSLQYRVSHPREIRWGWFRADHEGRAVQFNNMLWSAFYGSEAEASQGVSRQKQIAVWPDPNYGGRLRAFQVCAGDLLVPACRACGSSEWVNDPGQMDVMTGNWVHAGCRGGRRWWETHVRAPPDPARRGVSFPTPDADFEPPHTVVVAGRTIALPSPPSAFAPRRVRVRRGGST